MSDCRYLAVNLRRRRAELRLSQAAVASRAGVPISQSYLSHLERGLEPRDRGHVALLARALDVGEEELLRKVRMRSAGVAA